MAGFYDRYKQNGVVLDKDKKPLPRCTVANFERL